MSANTPQVDLQDAVSELTAAQVVLFGSGASVATSLANASRDRTLKAAQASVATGEQRLSTGERSVASALASVAAALVAINPPLPTVPQPDVPAGTFASALRLVFDDEFTGTNLDETKWTPGWWPTNGISGPVNSVEAAAYSAANIAVANGLSLAFDAGKAIASGSKTYPNTGALISSNPQGGGANPGFAFTYGYAETKVNLPSDSNGKVADWPAFWLDYVSGTYYEIDDFEGLSGTVAWHYHTDTVNVGDSDPEILPGWHTFGVNWQEGSITYYYDGQQIGSPVTEDVANTPMYLILGISVGSSQAAVSGVLQAEYVRVWQA